MSGKIVLLFSFFSHPKSNFQSYKIFLIILFCIFTDLTAIEVGGHILEDTIWLPENNPYSIVGNIFIEANVTLTILPGTQIELGSALLNNENYINGEYFMLVGEESVAKMFWVDGSIIAEGTEQDSIIFSRDNNLSYNYWGTIYFNDTSQKSVFKHCKFEYSSLLCLGYSNEPKGALSGKLDQLSVTNCTFKDNYQGIELDLNNDAEIINNSFFMQEGINPEWLNGSYQFVHISNLEETSADILFADNCLADSNMVEIYNFNTCLNNNVLSNIYVQSDIDTDYFISNNQIQNKYTQNAYYQNYIRNLGEAFIDHNSFSTNSNSSCFFYLKDGIISNNSFDGIRTYLDHTSFSETHIFINNVFYGQRLYLYEDYLFFNNILDACFLDMNSSQQTNFYNCLFRLTDFDVNYNNDNYFCNCAIFGDFGMYNLMFQGCITMNNIPVQNSGGRNIRIEEADLPNIYVDFYGHDYHLLAGCLAIDEGKDTLEYYYPFDLDYNYRVWDGDGNGSARIDIGPYEFDAEDFGQIQGYTYDSTTGETVDNVLIKINCEPAKIAFSNGEGFFDIPLPAGIYNLVGKRVFYGYSNVNQVEVIDGEITLIAMPMNELVAVQENEIIPLKYDFHLTNYPNPFNPSTTISFQLNTETTEKSELVIYNLKGQKVRYIPVILSVPNSSGFIEGSQFNNAPRPSTELRMTRAESIQYNVTWDGTDQNNKPVASGIYFCRLKIGNAEASRKMLLLK